MHLLIKTVSTILLIGIINFSAFAADEETLAQQAEQAGEIRKAFAHYVEALKSAPVNQQLREKIIKLAQQIQPPPALTEDAKRHMARGQAAIKAAKTQEDWAEAVKEYEKAVYFVPWYADAYYNLGIARDKAGQHDGAIWALRMYLMAKPLAEDSEQVKNLIFEIEYRQEKAANEISEKARLEQEKARRPAAKLGGTWIAEYSMETGGNPPYPWKETYKIEPQGTNFNLILIDPGNSPYHGSFSLSRQNNVFSQLEIDGSNIKGIYLQRFNNRGGCNPPRDQPVTGEVRDGGSTIMLRFSVSQATPVAQSISGPITGCTQPYLRSLQVILRRLQ